MTFRIIQEEIDEELDRQHALDEIYLGYDGNDDEFFHQKGYKALHRAADTSASAAAAVGEEGDDDEKNFLAIKPWVGSLFPPEKYRVRVKNGTRGEYEPVFTEENNNWDEPDIDLELDYAFGYRARDCRNNIQQIGDHKVLYHCAALGVVKNLQTLDEDFLEGHTGDVLCLDYHAPSNLICSGSSAANYEAQLCVWNSETNKRIHNIKGFHRYAVVSCAINPQGTMILSIGLDEHHSVALHCVVTGLLLACSQADKSRVVHGRFMQCLQSKSETTFVTVGTKHVKFWGPVEDTTMTSYADPDYVDKLPGSEASESGCPDGYAPNTYMVSQNPEECRLVSISGSKCKNISRVCFLSLEFTKTHVMVGASDGCIYAFHAATKQCDATFTVLRDRILSMTYVGDAYAPRGGKSHTIAVGTGSGMLYFFKASYDKIGGDELAAKELSFDLDKSMGGGSGKINVNLFNEATKSMDTEDPESAGETINSYPASIRALNYSPITKKLLVGTILSHIYSLDPTEANKACPPIIVNGHWGDLNDPCGYGELWALASSPNSHHVVTACDDGMVRKWELVESVEVAKIYIGEPAISLSWSLNDEFIAVGLRDGGFVVLSSDLKRVVRPAPERTGRKVRVQDAQFSPSTEYLALGVEQHIEVYMCYAGAHPRTGAEVPAWTKIGELRGHSSLVTAFDWNIDSRLIQCSSNSYELLFYDIPSCERLVGEFLADQVWFTQTCTIGWPVQGIWPRYADGSDINCVAKSHSEQWVITGDDWSQMKMFNYPCIGSGTNRRTGQVAIKPQHKLFVGHASHVTNCVWTYDDSYVCTLGGRDLTMLVWKVNYNGVERRKHLLDADLIRKRMAKQQEGELGNNTQTHCYMCSYEFLDDVVRQCPICFANRVVHTSDEDKKRAWINLTESRHRLPTSAFAEHVKLQIEMRKKLQERKALPQMSNAPLIYKAPDDEASCTDSDDENGGRGIQNLNRAEHGGYVANSRRKLAPGLGTTRSGTQVTTSNTVPKLKKVISGKKTSGPDFRDY